VLLDADPLANLSNTRRIGWVMQNGRVWQPAGLLPRRATDAGRSTWRDR
jgi:hypothetical protein